MFKEFHAHYAKDVDIIFQNIQIIGKTNAMGKSVQHVLVQVE